MTSTMISCAQHFHFTATEPCQILDALADISGLSKQTIKDAAQKGALWITRDKKAERLRRVKNQLKTGQQLDLYYNPEVLHQQTEDAVLIADLEDYSIWCKPRGMLSQGSKWSDHTALYRWVETHYQPNGQNRQCWLVHRLDRATCGLQLLAHNKKTAQRLTQMFAEHNIDKHYQAWVHGKLDDKQTITTPIDDKAASTHIEPLDYLPEFNISLLAISIEQGRKHQIRKHLACIDHPIIGDRLHGSVELDQKLNQRIAARDQELNTDEFALDLQLTAYQLSYICPVQKKRVIYQLEQELKAFYPFQ